MVARSCVAVIPARGGSKRIEKKNIIDFCGKPMIAWTIEAAQKSARFAQIVVSTDDPAIAEVAQRYGVPVPFLREQYADDMSPVSLATIGALRQLRDRTGEEYDIAVQLMPNCPLRNEHHIVMALDHFMAHGERSQISCFRFGWMNPWWAATLSDDKRPTTLFPEAATKRSQDLPDLYCPTGAIWAATVPQLFEYQSYYTPQRIFWPMEWQAAVDIDDYDDMRLAEVLYSMRNHS